MCISLFEADYLASMVKFQFLEQFPVHHRPHPVSWTLCTCLLHSFIMRLIVSFLSSHNQHWLFCCILCIFTFFWAAIWRDSISLLKCPFLSHVQVSLCEILLGCCMKYPYSCFSSYFCFLVIIFLLIMMLAMLVTIIRLSLFSFYVVINSLYWCIHAIFSTAESSSSFLSRHILSIYVIFRMWSKVKWFVISFLVLWFICASSFLIYFKNGPKYLTRRTA